MGRDRQRAYSHMFHLHALHWNPSHISSEPPRSENLADSSSPHSTHGRDKGNSCVALYESRVLDLRARVPFDSVQPQPPTTVRCRGKCVIRTRRWTHSISNGSGMCRVRAWDSFADEPAPFVVGMHHFFRRQSDPLRPEEAITNNQPATFFRRVPAGVLSRAHILPSRHSFGSPHPSLCLFDATSQVFQHCRQVSCLASPSFILTFSAHQDQPCDLSLLSAWPQSPTRPLPSPPRSMA